MLNTDNLNKINIKLFFKEFNPTIKIGEAINGSYILISLSKIVHLLFG